MKRTTTLSKTVLIVAILTTLGISGTGYTATAVNQLNDSLNSSNTVATATAKINLNTADAATIVGAAVKGIGVKRAQAIVDYRNQHGVFKSFEDLAKVKGLGEGFIKTHLNRLAEVFTFS